MKTAFLTSTSLAALAITAAGEPAEWVQLFPYGEVAPNDGRKPWLLKDKAAAERVIATSMKRVGSRAELVIDYDHQSDFSAVRGVGGRAPAAGWMKQLEAREDGIWARVEWTAEARAALTDGQYRYISPTFVEDKQRNIAAILRAGLTNNPALDLAAVASEQPVQPGDNTPMDKALLEALGLPETATQEQVLERIATLTAEAAQASTAATTLAAINTAAGLTGAPDGPAICAAIKTLKGGSDSDLRETVVTLTERLAELEQNTANTAAESAVDAAIEAGKITPAARSTFIELASSDPERFAKIVAVSPTILKPGPGNRQKVDPDTVTLSDEDRAICLAMEMSEEDFLAAKKEGL
ncbi:MAG: hypothetical protein GC145_14410 [Caulobacter sp.]|nr:hypothetical protein [Caulobacter sp.]